jgi:hypothetical protein
MIEGRARQAQKSRFGQISVMTLGYGIGATALTPAEAPNPCPAQPCLTPHFTIISSFTNMFDQARSTSSGVIL